MIVRPEVRWRSTEHHFCIDVPTASRMILRRL